ncbi:hypothetical protein L1987_03702 [Smallanthus sonchifolius]|uniref:Uncharacterized protein n=1 Tax=Smallanthus sonchifolius TaxID=185202 RepID=A0ACB9KB86_9ASTR|nr:hypothetical protein L1987_03702 [Smallanthus sonchifolius]
MESYRFPVGLLPVGVTGYTLDEETGEFEVYLGETCSYTVQGYNLKYQSTISGLSRDGDELYLSVAILSEGFDVSGFIESPQCGCGFYCNDIGSVEIKEEEKMELRSSL